MSSNKEAFEKAEKELRDKLINPVIQMQKDGVSPEATSVFLMSKLIQMGRIESVGAIITLVAMIVKQEIASSKTEFHMN
jgi:hypothetical protein